METIKLENFLKDMGIDMPSKGKILELFYETAEYFPEGDFPYEFVDEVEQRGDGQGYETFWVFQRKSDGKYFCYYSYDGRVEEWELRETTKKVVVQWDFERQY